MADSSEQLKAIVVGATSQCCDSVGWTGISQTNFVDYDVAILIVRDLDSVSLTLDGKVVSDTNNQLKRLLASGGQLIVVTPGAYPTTIRSSPTVPTNVKINLASFLPIPVIIQPESGDTVSMKSGVPFSGYLRRIRKWEFWAGVHAQGSYTPYLVNREGKVLAGHFSFNNIGLTILPDIPTMSTDQIAQELLSELGFAEQEVEAPDWAETIPVPGLDDIDAAISESRMEISNAEKRLGELRDDREKLNRYRKLLYSTGDDLENVVADVLTQFGCKLSGQRHGVEDLLGEVGDQPCVFEVTGLDGPLKLAKVRQLLDHAFLIEEKTDERPKAVLIANPLKLVPPSMRDKAKTPEFPPNVVTRAEETRIALVSGRWLFDKYCEFLDKKIAGPDVLDEILRTDGLVG